MRSTSKWCAAALVFATLIGCNEDKRAAGSEGADAPVQAERAPAPDTSATQPEAEAKPADKPKQLTPAPTARVLASAPLPVFAVARLGTTGMPTPGSRAPSRARRTPR